jgi:electron transfer flavoprotein beta subunit
MDIVVLIKTVDFIYAQTGTHMQNNYIGPDDIVQVLNPDDELALEYALSIKDAYPQTVVRTISLGNQSSKLGLETSIAMGADKALHINCKDYEHFDSWATASILALACRQISFDLILCGGAAIDHNTGLVGHYTAEIMAIPHLSRVVKILVLDNPGRIQIERVIERGDRQLMQCQLPALFCIHKSAIVPRYPKLAGWMRAETQEIETLFLKDLGFGDDQVNPVPNLTDVVELMKPLPIKRKGPQTENMSAKERLERITKPRFARKTEAGNIFEGDSDQVFSRFDQILRETGILTDTS